MKNLSIAILGILIAVQLAVPVTMIQGKEKILQEGTLYKLLTRPIDPADPFQGRYVRLGYRNDYIPCPADHKPDLRYNEPIYALIVTDDTGFLRFIDWSHEKPATGNYLKTRYKGIRKDWQQNSKTRIHKGIRIDIPFDRYYMDEAKAPRAEVLARKATRSTNCWVNVRILNGKAVIEDVFAEGQSLRDLAAKKD